MDDILDRISAVEDDMTWDEKIDQAVWRGTSWFNPLGYPNLRKDLLRATKGKEWADILALEGSEDANALSIEEFCRYKYVVYTEGVTYSGRLPYHQACGSVLVMAPMTWVTVSGLMLKPIWGAELMKGGVGMDEERSDVGKEELVEIEASGNLAMVHRYEDANAVYVKPDFSDLEALVEFLRESEHVARRIARNQRETMVGGGYLTSAAETCYWKALIRGWASKASIKEEAWTTLKEERYETWLLKEVNREIQNVRGRSL